MEITHDGFFKALMEEPGTAGALLRERLPEEVVRHLAPGEPELVDGSFIDEELRESRSDRLYRMALLSGGEFFVYCLVEHKSAPDPRVGLQLLRYLARIWERLDREAHGRGRLPPIVPLVVYHGAGRWNAPARFVETLEAAEALRPHLLDFPIRVMDVGKIEDDHLSRDRRLRVGLLLLKYATRTDAGKVVEILTGLLVEMRGLPPELFERSWRYIVGAYGPLDVEMLSEALRRAMPEKEEQMLSIAARQWLAEGRAEGRAQGQAEGQAKALERVLLKRFGKIPSVFREAMASADIAQLDAWIERAIDADSIEAVFAVEAH